MFAIVKIDILLNLTRIFKNINKVLYLFIKDQIFHNIILYFNSSCLDVIVCHPFFIHDG
jgi:hypothetical protein